ncbi:MAG: hypothetical protein HY725_07755 [Candidatus Rokubacteria bacterium]|nr:hypothetical protein [Candidatus Rokubacteria bacterium]
MKNRQALAGTLILALALELTSAAEALIRTGSYTGSGANQTIQTGLTITRSFRVVELPDRGRAAEGYTTDTMQSAETDAFPNGSRKDTGIRFETPQQIVISNHDFIAAGARYHWEAHGE